MLIRSLSLLQMCYIWSGYVLPSTYQIQWPIPVSSIFETLPNLGLLSQPELEMIIPAFVPSHLDFCNSLFICLSKSSLDHLQMVQNAAAKLLTRSSKTTHTTPILAKLQIHFKFALCSVRGATLNKLYLHLIIQIYIIKWPLSIYIQFPALYELVFCVTYRHTVEKSGWIKTTNDDPNQYRVFSRFKNF